MLSGVREYKSDPIISLLRICDGYGNPARLRIRRLVGRLLSYRNNEDIVVGCVIAYSPNHDLI